MTAYEKIKMRDLPKWQKEMLRKPNLINKLSKRLQDKMNSFIPEKAHHAITATIKQMIKGVLFGAEKLTKDAVEGLSFEEREEAVENKIANYQKTAAAEGGITGAGGILLGLADFPILLAIKLKLLFDIAAIYGYDVKHYKERLYILYIFQLSFCSKEQQRSVYLQMSNWQQTMNELPNDINELDWRKMQQEYRDYIDIAKMLQLVPVIGAPVGAIVNYRLIRKLGETAKNAYRMRRQVLLEAWFVTSV